MVKMQRITATERKILKKYWSEIGESFHCLMELFVIPDEEDRSTLLKFGWSSVLADDDYPEALTPGEPYYGMLAQHEVCGSLPMPFIRRVIREILTTQENDFNTSRIQPKETMDPSEPA